MKKKLFNHGLWLKIMKLSIIQLVLAVCFVGLCYSRDVNAQEIFETRISIRLEDKSLKTILSKLEKEAKVKFMYSAEVIQSERIASLNVKNQPLGEVLETFFNPLNISYRSTDNGILLIPKAIKLGLIQGIDQPKNEMVVPSDITVKGIVTDEKGEKLSGVSITLKGTTRGSTSNNSGEFSIVVPNDKAILIFSYVGYNPQEQTVGKRTIIEVSLRIDNKTLNEVVVVGYGQVNRKDLTGSVAKANVTDMQKAPVRSFEEALGGRVAGVQVTGADGQPGGNINIVIRGNNSVSQDNSPLYVIDGFPIERPDNNFINPSEIESMEILKDASATAIYGARGANGVIIITTKKGKEGPAIVNYEAYYGSQTITKKIPMLSPYEFVKLQLDINPTGATNTYLKNDLTLEGYKNVKPVNMQDLVFLPNVPMQSHSVSVNGGSKTTRYSLSANVFDQSGIITNSNFKRYQGRMTLDQTINSNLKVGTNISYTNTISKGTISSNNSQNSSSGRLQGAINASGYLMYNVWGYRPTTGNSTIDYSDELIDPATTDLLAYPVNPLVQLQNEIRIKKSDNLIINTYIEQRFLKDLKLRTTFGINKNLVVDENFNNSSTSLGNPITSPNAIGVNGSVLNSNFDSWVNENTLTYQSTFSRQHNLNVLIGITSQGGKTEGYGLRAIQIPNESLGINGLDEGNPSTITATNSEWTLASYLGRVNYSFDGRYLATVSFRSDGSSRFSPQNRWGYFPSGSLAWRFSKEKFMEKLKFIDDAKLRFGFGATGNNRVNDFAYLSVISTSTNTAYSFGNATPSSGATPTRLGNEDLKWETTTQYNLGLDISLFDKKIDFTTDIYRKITSDLLLNAALPLASGYPNIFRNIGKVQNEGLEFSVTTDNVNTKNFKWSSNINIAFNQNKVLALTDNQESQLNSATIRPLSNNPVTITKLDNPIALFYGYIWDGVYQYTDFDKLPNGQYVLKSNVSASVNSRVATQPGDVKYRDINGDGVVNINDNTVIGNPNPKHIGGFSNNFSYKNFDLNIFFQWSYGNDIVNMNRVIFEGGGEFPNNLNQYATVAERWSPDNPSNTMHKFTASSNLQTNLFSTRVVEDGSFLRLKTVSLGYSLPNELLKKLKIRTFRIYASAQNLITWTKYSGYDPEVSVINSALTPGIDLSAYPRARTLTVGLNLSF